MKLIKIENQEETFEQSISDWLIGSDKNLYEYLQKSFLSQQQYQAIRVLLTPRQSQSLNIQKNRYDKNIQLLYFNISQSITSSYNIWENDTYQYNNFKNQMNEFILQSTNSFQKYVISNKNFQTINKQLYKHLVDVPQSVLQACTIPYKVIMTQQNFSSSWNSSQYYRKFRGNLLNNQIDIIKHVSKMYQQPSDQNKFRFLLQIIQPPKQMIRYVNRRIKDWQIIHPSLSIGNYYIGNQNNTLQFIFYKKLTTLNQNQFDTYKMLEYPSIRKMEFTAIQSDDNNIKRIIIPRQCNESNLIADVSYYIRNSLINIQDNYLFDYRGKSVYLTTQYSNKVLKNINIKQFTLEDTLGYYNNLIPYEDISLPRVYFKENNKYFSNQIKFDYPNKDSVSQLDMRTIDDFLFSPQQYSNISAICYSQNSQNNKYGFLHQQGKYAIVFKAKLENRSSLTSSNLNVDKEYNNGVNNLNVIFNSMAQIQDLNLIQNKLLVRILPEDGIKNYSNLLNNDNIGITSQQTIIRKVLEKTKFLKSWLAESLDIDPGNSGEKLRRRHFGAVWISFKEIYQLLNLEKNILYYNNYADKILLSIYHTQVRSKDRLGAGWGHKVRTYLIDKDNIVFDKTFIQENKFYDISVTDSSEDDSDLRGFDFPYYGKTRRAIRERFTNIINMVLGNGSYSQEQDQFKDFFKNKLNIGILRQSLSYDALTSVIYGLDYNRSTLDKKYNTLLTENFIYIMYKDLKQTFNEQDTEYPENYYNDLFIYPYTDSVNIVDDDKWADDTWQLFNITKKIVGYNYNSQQPISILQSAEQLLLGKYQYLNDIRQFYKPINFYYSQSNSDIFNDQKNTIFVSGSKYKLTRKPLKPRGWFSDFNFMFDKYGQFITYRTLNKRYFQYNNNNYVDMFGDVKQNILEIDSEGFYKCYAIIDKYYQGNSMLSFLINQSWSNLVTDKKIQMIKFSLKDVFIYQITSSNWYPQNDLNQKVQLPRFSHNSSIYRDNFYLQITSDEYQSVIKYTKDGTLPNINSSVYINPIFINQNVTISAICYKNNITQSNIAIRFYQIEQSNNGDII